MSVFWTHDYMSMLYLDIVKGLGSSKSYNLFFKFNNFVKFLSLNLSNCITLYMMKVKIII